MIPSISSENRKTVGCKLVFKKKIEIDGEISRYKARLIAQGFSSKYGDDYVMISWL